MVSKHFKKLKDLWIFDHYYDEMLTVVCQLQEMCESELVLVGRCAADVQCFC